MTSNTRRPGFRLWGGDSDDETGEQAADQVAEQATPEPTEATDATPDAAAVEPATQAAATDAQADAAAQAESSSDPSPESAEFLSSLVSAMRSVAEEARDGSLAEFRSTVERRINELEAEATSRGEDLRRQADLDAEAIASWERREIERVKADAEAKARDRREQLDGELAEHQASSERRVAGMRDKLAQHERALSDFFNDLTGISDPTRFVTMAKRMPRPPLVADDAPSTAAATPTAAPTTAEPDAEEATVTAALPDTTEAGKTASNDEPASAESPAAIRAPGRTLEARLAELGVEPSADEAPEQPEAVETAVADEGAPNGDGDPVAWPEEGGQRDRQLTDRLAELDSKLADAAPTEAATSNGTVSQDTAAGETSTAIIVKGLGSFGAITSFKQALERVDGVEGVTLSLGPTGEFVYRASHAPQFDVIAAVRAVEGAGAEIERADGAVRVTVSRNR